ETSYLDNNRLIALSIDAADVVSLYMLLLLYRQLVHSQHFKTDVSDTDLTTLKREIRDIAPPELGYCFLRTSENNTAVPNDDNNDSDDDNSNNGDDDDDDRKRRTTDSQLRRDVILHVAMRAKAAQDRSPTPPSSPLEHVPDNRMVK